MKYFFLFLKKIIFLLLIFYYKNFIIQYIFGIKRWGDFHLDLLLEIFWRECLIYYSYYYYYHLEFFANLFYYRKNILNYS